jgi:hypothetical protein
MDADVAQETITKTDKPATGSGAGQEIFLGLLWLGTGMYSTHMEIKGTSASGILGNAATALPGLIAGTMVAGLGIAAAVASRFRSAAARLGVGLGVGVLFGLATAAGIRFGYGNTPSITILALTVGAASVVGGILAALPGEIVDAAMWGATWVFFAGVIFGVWQPNATKLLGGGSTADTRFVWGTTILTGVIGGVYAYRNLRNEKINWLCFLVAGALPGAFLLGSEVLTRIGGASVAKFVHGLSASDAALVQVSDASRLRYALFVLGIGAVVAAVMGARALARKDD